MADVFGDLTLFSEFDKDREEGSFIHYDEDNVKSRIVFEDYESDTECESDASDGAPEDKLKDGNVAMHADNATDARPDDEVRQCSKDEKLYPDANLAGNETASSKGDGLKTELAGVRNGHRPVSQEPKAHLDTINKFSGDSENISSWLNAQLYEDAANEASKSSTTTQQLIYQRNKYRRYAKMLDSTRYAPDEESPAVQLLFNNNQFARKYRQQIEQFIKGLLWDEIQSSNQDSDSEITVKPGAPSCIDINPDLSCERRTEHMRQKHALIGNSQFHQRFSIDFLGWPFNIAEPTRCNVNWEIPLYGQVFNEVYADPSNKPAKKTDSGKPKRPKPSCWNCGEENHAVVECRQPRNPANIAANRQAFMEAQQNAKQSSEPKFSGPSRYHLDPELASIHSRFRPGCISDELQKALGLNSDQLPQHIYKMRLYGYPPGWLAEAKQIQSGVSVFDKNGRVTTVIGEAAEEGEVDTDENQVPEINVNKIIEYPGFTVPVPDGIQDEHATFKMPPIQQHQLKKTLMAQNSEQKEGKKRKRGKDREGKEKEVKRMKKEESSENSKGEVSKEEIEEGEEGEEEERESGMKEETDEVSEDMKEEQMETLPQETAACASISPAMVRSSSTISLGKDFGTPILVRQKSSLPDPSKFSVGVEEHIPFENLPNATGTFEKMKGILDLIKQKAKK